MTVIPEFPTRAEVDYIDFRRLYSHVVSNRWAVLVCVVLTTVIFSLVAFLTRPVYRVTAVMASAEQERGDNVVGLGSSSLASLATGLGLGGIHQTATEEALAVLGSREFTERFITDEKLLPQLFPKKWNPATHDWKEKDDPPTLAEGYKYFTGKVMSISQTRTSELITIQIEWHNPQEAAAWANELVRRLNDEMRSRAITKADASLRFLEKQLQQTTSVEIRDALGSLIETQLKQRMIAEVTQDYSLRFIAPPIGSDGEKPVWPKKALLLALGPIAGFLVGILLTFLWRSGYRGEP
jgi:uncharacterized protein involved in exopolysaccharide biosynthesis